MPRFRGSLIAAGVAVATVAGAAGIAADAASTSGEQAVSLSYTCAFPGGVHRVSVEIAVTVAPGPRVGPVGLRVTTRLPPAALATYSGQVRATDLLTVTEARGSAKPVTVTW